jgi:hypothetical protein
VKRCSRCGLPSEGPDITGVGRCYARLGSDSGDLGCRDRELANLRSLLRSVTGQLERAHDWLTIEPTNSKEAAAEIEAVLEVLS